MKQLIFLFLLSLVGSKSFSQAPFTTLVQEPRFLKRAANDSKLKAATEEDKSSVESFITSSDSTFTKNNADSVVERSVKNDFDFFRNNALSYNFLNKGENRASINAQVLYYKLYVANPNDQNTYRLNRYNVPLMLISKLSTNYDSVSASTAIDVLDYEAAPITIRVMPSFKKHSRPTVTFFIWGFMLT